MQKQETESAAISLALIFLVLLIAVGLIVELLRLDVPGIWAALFSGDENALQAYFEGRNRLYSACLLWLLSFFQVLSIFRPPCQSSWSAASCWGTGLAAPYA